MLKAANVDLYYGAAQALRGVSFSAEIGKVSALMGRNGVGKTSFLRAIIGEQPIAAGEIALDGRVLGRMAPHDRARLGIAYVPQGRDIFPLLTVKENLETGYTQLPRSERSIPSDVFDLFPVLADMLRRRGGDLSGGQQQQLRLLRQQHADLQPLLLAVAKIGGEHVAPVAEANDAEDLIDALGRRGRRPAEERRCRAARTGHRQFEVVAHRMALEDGRLLELAADAERGNGRLVKTSQVDGTVEIDVAGIRPRLAGDHVHHGGLAGAIGADDGTHLARLDDQRERVQRLEAIEGDGDAVEVEQ